jgi:serine/threonine protein kinase
MNKIHPNRDRKVALDKGLSGPLESMRRRRRVRRATAEVRSCISTAFHAAPTMLRVPEPTNGDIHECYAAPESSIDSEPQPLLRTGDILADKYRIEALLGRGGMGSVYAADHLELGLRVAIKVPHHDSLAARARLIREARTCALVASDHIPRVFDLGRFPGGAPYIVMECLAGEDLAKVITRGPVAPREGALYVLQACAALSDAHAAGVVHRDLKPANLFLTKRNRAALIKVLDFGISTRVGNAEPTNARAFTVTSAHLGSPQYMSPEQIRSRMNVDERTDIWSLGVILYELLTGKPPFGGSTLFALSVAIVTEKPVPPSHHRAGVPRSLEDIVQRCLEKNPAERYASVKDLMRAMKPFS